MIPRLTLIAVFAGGCAGSGALARTAEPSAATWRVVSYNIRHGRGMDGQVDLERTASVLRRLDPDIVALQEVDSVVTRSGGIDQARRLGELLGLHDAFGAFMEYQGGRYGMAVLSRCPILRHDPVRLTNGNEPRVALAVEIALPDGVALTVVNVHFDWVDDDGFRFAQATEVARHLEGLRGPWILAGDFNDRRGTRTLNLFHERAVEAAKPRDRQFTFPSEAPAREIDFIFVSANDGWSVQNVEVVGEAVASDHRPVAAGLALRTEDGTRGRVVEPCRA